MIASSTEGVGNDPNDLLEALATNVEAAKTILTCAAHQKRVIEDVLILNRLEHTKLSITPVPVDVPKLLKDISSLFQVELDADGMHLTILQDPSFEPYVTSLFCCDPSRLTQIFMNLISNALKFTRDRPLRNIAIRYGAALEPPGQETASMTSERLDWSLVSKERRDLTVDPEWGHGEPVHLQFSVQDTGPGLEAIEVQRLFNRFSQANAKTHITYGGAGLGLFISRELTEMQGGKIGVASTPGIGTTIAFYVKTRRSVESISTRVPLYTASSSNDASGLARVPVVPRSATSPTPLGVTLHRHKTSLQTKEPPPQNQNTGIPPQEVIRLLLVEDNLVNQKILCKQLRRAGCEVYTANHGVEALEFLKTTTAWCCSNTSTSSTGGPSLPRSRKVSIDMILMDWEMPIMDGLTCSRRIRSLEHDSQIKHLPIIAITANARQEQIQTALDAGIDEVITKPFLVPELMVKVKKWMEVDKG